MPALRNARNTPVLQRPAGDPFSVGTVSSHGLMHTSHAGVTAAQCISGEGPAAGAHFVARHTSTVASYDGLR